MSKYKPIMEFQYSRRLRYRKKGQVNYFTYKGRKVKAYITPNGRKLQILDISKSIQADFTDVEKVIPYDGKLKVVKKPPQPPQVQAPAPKKEEEKPKPPEFQLNFSDVI